MSFNDPIQRYPIKTEEEKRIFDENYKKILIEANTVAEINYNLFYLGTTQPPPYNDNGSRDIDGARIVFKKGDGNNAEYYTHDNRTPLQLCFYGLGAYRGSQCRHAAENRCHRGCNNLRYVTVEARPLDAIIFSPRGALPRDFSRDREVFSPFSVRPFIFSVQGKSYMCQEEFMTRGVLRQEKENGDHATYTLRDPRQNSLWERWTMAPHQIEDIVGKYFQGNDSRMAYRGAGAMTPEERRNRNGVVTSSIGIGAGESKSSSVRIGNGRDASLRKRFQRRKKRSNS